MKLEKNRLMDPNKYRHVKSKVKRNHKVSARVEFDKTKHMQYLRSGANSPFSSIFKDDPHLGKYREIVQKSHAVNTGFATTNKYV